MVRTRLRHGLRAKVVADSAHQGLFRGALMGYWAKSKRGKSDTAAVWVLS